MSSSAAEESPDGMALQSHYSLRWNNHQAHILQAFEALLHAEVLVDVTLVCAETSLRAHKVVLSVCSPFFERIFAEHPCKHPVIVLKDFPGREIAALIDFMYRGEVRVGREDLPGLMHAAESLQIRGLASSEPRPASPPETPTTDVLMQEPATPEPARQMLSPREEEEEENEAASECATPSSSAGGCHQSLLPREFARADHRLPHMGQLNFGSLRELRETCGSPLMPRRKQARPRRRSGELVPQDLSRPHPPPSLSPPGQGLNLSSSSTGSNPQLQREQRDQQDRRSREPSEQPEQPAEEEAENLSMKREPKRSLSPSSADGHLLKSESEAASSPRGSPLAATPGGGAGLHPDASFSDLPVAGLTAMSALSLTPPPPPHHHGSEYLTSLGQFAAQWLPNQQQQQQQQQQPSGPQHPRHPRDEGGKQPGGAQGPPPAGFPYPQGESPLAARGAFPALDGMTPLFPHGPPLDLHDSFKPESFHGLFVGASLGHHPHHHHHHPHHHHPPGKKSKKHRSDGIPRRWSDHARGLPVCRPKGQHSAPRGGPPRSWTNADLTEALTMVWNKKMTTSQASRVYGIPYNSLLMYVRGKYGKSLKLEQLRRDCTAGEVMNSLNNNAVKPIEPPPPPPPPPPTSSNPRLPPLPPGLHEAEANFAHHPLLSGGLAQGFFPDFANFPVPVNMVHLLPPSEQKAFEPPTNPQPGNNSASNGQQQQQQRLAEAAEQLLRSRSPSPMPGPPAQSAPALLQQNGAD